MTFDDYQKAAMETAAHDNGPAKDVLIAALGLTGEAGEFADLIKKWYAQGHELDISKLNEEAGDILWYLALWAEVSGVSLGSIAEQNRAKLAKRYPEGTFSVERSISRDG